MTTIGQHRVTHGNVDDAQVDQMLAGERVWTLYSDPPWGDGNMEYWRTMNRKMTGEDVPQISHDRMLWRFRDLITKYVDGYAFIETGLRWQQPWVENLKASGLVNLQTVRVFYGSSSKLYENVLICGSRPGVPAPLLDGAEKLRGLPLPTKCLGAVARPRAIVLDPCCGMGYTARAAVANGMIFRGNELNASRLAKTVAHLQGTVA